MNGNELLKKLRKLSRKRGLSLRVVNERGKGSHVTVWLGDRRTTLKDRKKEIGVGLFNDLLKQLGLNRSDLK